MKEIEIQQQEATRTRIEQQQVKRKKEQTLLIPPGLKGWKCDLTTGEITEVVAEKKIVRFIEAVEGNAAVHSEAIAEDTCIYVAALNKKNADRKFAAMLLDKIMPQ